MSGRKISRRQLLKGAAAGAAGLALSGCAVAATPQVVEKIVEKEVTAAPVQKVSLKVLDAWGPGPWAVELYSGWATGLAEKVPEAHVEFIPTLTGEVSTQKTAALLAAGTPPDITLGSDVRFAFEGVILNLAPFFEADAEVQSWQWNPPSWDFVNIIDREGNKLLWAFPGNSDARIIYVNLTAFKEAGLEYDPKKHWSWDEFRAACQALTKRKADGTAEQLAFNGFGSWYGDLYVWANYAGGDFWEIDPNTDWVVRATLDSPQCLEAIEFWYKLYAEDKVGPLAVEQGTQALQFLAGTIVMQPSWSSFLSSIRKAQQDGTLNFDWDLIGYPVMKAGDKWPNQFANGSQMGSILKACKQPEIAFKVLKYVAGPEGHLVRQRAMGAPPSILNIQSLWDEWLAPPPQNKWLYQEVMSQGKIGTWSKIKYDADKISQVYSNELDLLKNGQTTPKEFATKVTAQMNQIIEESYKREEGKLP
jgi:ABC-type glycerol-3-phosphate transport system substrate-binding protein